MNPDGSVETRVTTDQARNVQPAWSPDGTRIAFAKAAAGMHHIFTMDPNGSGGRVTASSGTHSAPTGSRSARTPRPTAPACARLRPSSARRTIA